MAKKPSNPRILPRVYNPPQDDPPPQPRRFGEDVGDAFYGIGSLYDRAHSGFNQTEKNIGNALLPAVDYLFGQGGKTAYPEDYQQKIARPVNAYEQYASQLNGMGQIPDDPNGAGNPQLPGALGAGLNALQGIPEWIQSLFGGGGGQTQTTPTNAPGVAVGRTPPGFNPGPSQGGQGGGSGTTDAVGKTPPGWVPTVGADAPSDAQTQAARLQDAVNKNQNLTQQAKDTGNDKELARLQAEWDRIAPKAAKYGITADRLINSYMQPGNPAAETSLDRAMGRAIADDTWANAATIAFGRAPNQLEWDEHWKAMNQGGRDPLEGHPASIQLIQQKMQEIEQENQNEAFGQYQNWLATQQ